MKEFLLSGWFWFPLIITAFAMGIISTIKRAETDDTVRIPRRVDTFNIAIATPQEVFDWVVFNLKTQGKQSRNDQGTCVYRGEDGCKCAAGFLIADAHYIPELEGTGWRYLQEMLPSARSRHTDMIEDLQIAHDTYSFNDIPDNIWAEMKRIAEKYRLSSAIVDAPI